MDGSAAIDFPDFRPSASPGDTHSSPTPLSARADADRPRVRNTLLTALPQDVLAQLLPRLEQVSLKRKQVLHQRSLPIAHAYFFEAGAASLRLNPGGRDAFEIATLGRQDFAGLPIVLGLGSSPHSCVMQTAGAALRLSACELRRAMRDIPVFGRLLLGYVQASITQHAQLAMCNARHSLGERLARSILLVQDRMDGPEVQFTHDTLAKSLGVRRVSVTTMLGTMERSGLVRKAHGRLFVMDRQALEKRSCGCYRVIAQELHRFLSWFSAEIGSDGASSSAAVGKSDGWGGLDADAGRHERTRLLV